MATGPLTLPTIRGGSVAMYPLTRGTLLTVAVQKFITGSEQRFKRHAPLEQFQLDYSGLYVVDRDALAAFYFAVLGAYNDTWQFTMPGILSPGTVPANPWVASSPSVWTTCTFVEDTFSSVESGPGLYDVSFRFRQVQKGGQPLSLLRAVDLLTFPLLGTGATAQRPYTRTVRYHTEFNDNPTGQKYAWSFYDSDMVNYPTRGLLSWTLPYPSIEDWELTAIEAFFVAMNGRWKTFSFTDPDYIDPITMQPITYTGVRFDQDTFTYKYLDMNHASTTIHLIETGNVANQLSAANAGSNPNPQGGPD